MKKAVLRSVIASLAVVAVLAAGCAPPEITSAKIYYNNQDYANARISLEKAIVTYPDNAEAYYMLGKIDLQEQKYDLAYQHYTKAKALNPGVYGKQVDFELGTQWTSSFNNSVALLNRGDMDQAFAQLEICTTLQPDRPQAYNNLAFIYGQRGEVDQALTMYEKVLALDPANKEARKNSGLLCFNKKEYQKAVEFLAPLAEENLTDSIVVSTLGATYDQLGQRQKTIDLYKKALQATPESPDLVWDLAYYYIQADDMDTAMPYLLQTIQMDPFNVVAMRIIALNFVAKDDDQGAFPYLQKITELDPADADTWELLGIYWVRNGDPKKGAELIQKAETIRKMAGESKEPPPVR